MYEKVLFVIPRRYSILHAGMFNIDLRSKPSSYRIWGKRAWLANSSIISTFQPPRPFIRITRHPIHILLVPVAGKFQYYIFLVLIFSRYRIMQIQAQPRAHGERTKIRSCVLVLNTKIWKKGPEKTARWKSWPLQRFRANKCVYKTGQKSPQYTKQKWNGDNEDIKNITRTLSWPIVKAKQRPLRQMIHIRG